MIDCSCYHDETNCTGKRGVCWGTKEREPCSCGGDATKCDFYPTVRKEGKKPVTKADAVRAMSDEQLANQLVSEQYVATKSTLSLLCQKLEDEEILDKNSTGELLRNFDNDAMGNWGDMVKEKLEWLKQEAEE